MQQKQEKRYYRENVASVDWERNKEFQDKSAVDRGTNARNQNNMQIRHYTQSSERIRDEGEPREGEERGAVSVIALFTDVRIASCWRSRWEISRCLRAREKRRENDVANLLGDETSFIAARFAASLHKRAYGEATGGGEGKKG